MGRMSNESASLREKKEKIMDKILDKIDIELDTISSNSSIETDKVICENVETLVRTFNVLDIWMGDIILPKKPSEEENKEE